jgi:hypothetical protein
MFLFVGLLYLTLLEDGKGDTAAFLSFAVVATDLIVYLLFKFVAPVGYLQQLSAVACTLEGILALLAFSSVDLDEADANGEPDVVTALRLYFIAGGQLSALKISFASQKISLLRFPFLFSVLLLTLIAEIICLFLVIEQRETSPGPVLTIIFLLAYDLVALVNSRVADAADRNMYIMLVNEKSQKDSLAAQIKRTNKLAATVLAMNEAEANSSYKNNAEGAAEASPSVPVPNELVKSNSSRLVTTTQFDMVSEFDFFYKLIDTAKTASEFPSSSALCAIVPEMGSLDAVMKDPILKKGFRFFCNEELNLENLLFYEQVEIFRRHVSERTKKISKVFVNAGSPSEINIKDSMRKEALKASELSSKAFDDAQDEIFRVMSNDTFPRYRDGWVGRALMHGRSNEEFKNMIEGALLPKSTLLEETTPQPKKSPAASPGRNIGDGSPQTRTMLGSIQASLRSGRKQSRVATSDN